MPKRLPIWTACLVMAIAPTATAQEASLLPARLVDGKPFSATLLKLDGKQAVFESEVGKRSVPLDDLLVWGHPAAARKGSYLLLTDGSVVAGEVTAIAAEQLSIRSSRRPGLWKSSQVARKEIKAIVYQSSASPAERERFNYDLLSAADAQDRLLLIDGDSLTGSLLDAVATDESPAATLRFLLPGSKEPLSITFDRVAAIVFTGKPATVPTSYGDFWLSLADGSLVLVDELVEAGETVSFKLASGSILQAAAVDADVEPPETLWSRVTYLQPLPARVTYLSDLSTIGFKHIPLLDWQQEYANDRSVTHSGLRAGGHRFVKGISMPATSRLAYEVPEGAKRFEAEVAVDDDAGRAGSVVFRVFLESPGQAWKPAFESKTLRGSDPPESVRLDLGEARRLALVVDMADRGDQHDWADWLNARFVK